MPSRACPGSHVEDRGGDHDALQTRGREDEHVSDHCRLHVSLMLDVRATPVVGAIRLEHGPERTFRGWIELFSVLDGLARPSDDVLVQAATEGAP